MGNWDEWVNNSPNCTLKDTFYPLSGFGQGHFLDDYNDYSGVHSFLTLNFSKQLFEAVTLCSPLASIISKLADAYANGKQEVLNRSTQNYVRGKYKEWERLMDKPNPLQTKTQYRKQLYAFAKINGWCYVMPEYIAGFDVPAALWILPPYLIEVETVSIPASFPIRDPKQYRKLYFVWNGVRQPLDESKLILFTDTQTDIDERTMLPVSRLVSIRKPISNIIAGMDARNNLIVQRGALGFLSSDGQDAMGARLPILPNQRREINSEFQKSYGITGKRSFIAVVSSAVKWTQTAMNTRELMLFEEHEGSTLDIADRLNYPPYLLGAKDGTFSNVGEAEKSLYQNTIMPDAVGLDETLNEGLKTPQYNIEVRTDYSHIEALQQSEVEAAEARKKKNDACSIEWEKGLISINQWKEYLGDDIIGEKEENLVNPTNPYNMRKPQYDKWLIDEGFAMDTINPKVTNNFGNGK